LSLQQQKPIKPWEMLSLLYSSKLWQILWYELQHISTQLSQLSYQVSIFNYFFFLKISKDF